MKLTANMSTLVSIVVARSPHLFQEIAQCFILDEQQFWQPNDPHDYYNSIWHDKTVDAGNSKGELPMTYILWVDYEKPAIAPMTSHLSSDPRVHITFQPTFTQATEYILLNIEKIKALPQSSVFQIICRGYYASEDKNPFDLLPFLTRHKLEYVPIIVITSDKKGVLDHFTYQGAVMGIQHWKNRIYVTNYHAELITRINANLIKKHTSQHHSWVTDANVAHLEGNNSLERLSQTLSLTFLAFLI